MLETTLYILLGVLIAIPVIKTNIRYSLRWGLVDYPKARGVREESVPIIGPSLVLISLILLAIGFWRGDVSSWFFVTACGIALMGFFDDRKPLPPLEKMVFQTVCVVGVVFFDPNIRDALTIRYGVTGTLWGVFFILGLLNALNFIDGIDGLAGSVILVGAIGFLLYSRSFEGFAGPYRYVSVLSGVMLPFLYFNIKKRKGFLGNIGSYFFAYFLAVLHLSLPMETKSATTRMALSGLCFVIPVADACFVILNRVATLRSPFEPDRGHLHHRLLQSNIPLRYILVAFGVVELFGVGTGYQFHLSEASRFTSLPVMVTSSYLVIVGMLILILDKSSKRRTQSYFQRLDSGEPLYYLKYHLKTHEGKELALSQLSRIEARVSSEVRVDDICFGERPSTIFVTISAGTEGMAGVMNRLKAVFDAEGLQTFPVVDEGQFVKVPRSPVQSLFKTAA